MCLLPSRARAAATALAYVPQDLPLAAEVMLNVCGVANFGYNASTSQCHYHVFGFGIAWTECSYIHRGSSRGELRDWKECVRGCALDGGLCKAACAGGVPSLKTTQEECAEECSKASSCLERAVKSSFSQADASDDARSCLETLRKPAGMGGPPPGVLLELGSRQRRGPAKQLAMFAEGCELKKLNGRWRKQLVVPAPPAPFEPSPDPLDTNPFSSKEMETLRAEYSQMTTTVEPPGMELMKKEPPPLPPVLVLPLEEIPLVDVPSGLSAGSFLQRLDSRLSAGSAPAARR